MRLDWIRSAALAACATALMSGPASAQKAKDTLRIAVNNPFAVLSPYHVPVDEAGAFYRDVYEGLVGYDEHNGKYVPLLAKAWRRVAPDTLEFDLRDDIKFHNGNRFDADDVVATINYVRDPKVRLTFKARYTWIKEVRKLGPYKVRIVAETPRSVDLSLITYRFVIWDAESMAGLKDVADYGKDTPYGTGPYKVLKVDAAEGTTVERYEGYNTNPAYKSAPIRRLHAIPMPDRQTQVAELITGGIEVLRNPQADQARELKADPRFAVTAVPTPSIFYIALDAAGVSGNKALTDKRVRLAVHKAINREAIRTTLVPGGEVATKLDALCFESTIACKYSVKAPDYDPEGAKKLLAEAGYPDGFEMTYSVYTPMRQLGEAVAGDLLKVGIRAKLQPVTIGLYRRIQRQGGLQAWSILFPTGTHPDASNILGVYFNGPAFKYYNDPVIRAGIDAGDTEFDAAKRADHYAKVFDQVNREHYILPVTSIPTVFVHTKDVKIVPDRLSAGDVWISSFTWN